jgi:hypothetical protein
MKTEELPAENPPLATVNTHLNPESLTFDIKPECSKIVIGTREVVDERQ